MGAREGRVVVNTEQEMATLALTIAQVERELHSQGALSAYWVARARISASRAPVARHSVFGSDLGILGKMSEPPELKLME